MVLEEAGRSLLGPQALNAAAPDEGNIHLLAHLANPTQRNRYLLPLAAGEIRSSFAMTEPMPGAGSDPDLLSTRAQRRGNSWILDGQKWFTTGFNGAGVLIVLARAPEGPTMLRRSKAGRNLSRHPAGVCATSHLSTGRRWPRTSQDRR